MGKEKVKIQEDLAGIIEKEKSLGRTVGFTNGCFDILHVGHVRYLQKARESCDLLVLGLNSDESVSRLKGLDRPINPQDARGEVLSALECVDYITIFEEDTPEKLIEFLTPDMLFKGGDWEEKDIVGAEHVKNNGGKVVVLPFVDGFSTTKLIGRIRE